MLCPPRITGGGSHESAADRVEWRQGFLRRHHQKAGGDPPRRAGHLFARWTHVRYKGSLALEPAADAVKVEIRSPDRGDEARLLSSFLGWLDRHFGEQLSSVSIQYR